MKKLFVIIFITILAFGCKTTKSVIKEDIKTNLTMHVDSASSLSINQHDFSDSSSVVAITTNDHTVERITQINYAKPDSTGKQSVLSEIVTERTNDKNLLKDIKTNVNTNSATNKVQDVKTNKDEKLKQGIKMEDTTISSLIPSWILYPIGFMWIVFFCSLLWKNPSISTWIKKILNIK